MLARSVECVYLLIEFINQKFSRGAAFIRLAQNCCLDRCSVDFITDCLNYNAWAIAVRVEDGLREWLLVSMRCCCL